MIATITAFPCPLERDQLEFDRCGTSPFTRAIDEAADLWHTVLAREHAARTFRRIAALEADITRLATYRAEDLGNFVICGADMKIELAAMPNMLRCMMSSWWARNDN